MKRLAGNMIALVAGDFGSRLLGFVVTVYLARVLGASGFGIVNIGLSVLGYAMLVVSPGVQFIETRNVAAGHERVNLILSLRCLLALLVTVIAAGLSLVVLEDNTVRLPILLFVCSTIPLALFLDWYYAGKEEFPVVSVARVLMSAVYLAGVLAVVHTPSDLVHVPLAFAAGNIAAVLVLTQRFLRAGGRLKFVLEMPAFVRILRENVPVGVTMFLAQSTVNLPPILLGWLVSTADAGIFSAGMKIVFLLLIADRVLHSLLLPVATRYYAGRKEEAHELLPLVTKWIMIAAIPVSMVGMVFASPIILLVFGSLYAPATLVLKILLAFFFFTLLNTISICVLIGSGNERSYSTTTFAGSVVTIILIVSGVVSAGVVGAAAGIVVGEAITVALMIAQVASVASTHIAKHLVRPAIGGAVMAGTLLVTQAWNPFVAVIVSLVVYGVALALLGTLNKTEVRYVMERFV